MMKGINLASYLLIGVLLASCANGQTSSLFVIGFAGPANDLSGAVAGVEGSTTTFVLEGNEPIDTEDVPFTMTLVEGAGGMTELVAIPAISSFDGVVQCAFSAGDAVCTEAAHEGSLTMSETTTFPFTVDTAVTLTSSIPVSTVDSGNCPFPPSSLSAPNAQTSAQTSSVLPSLQTTTARGMFSETTSSFLPPSLASIVPTESPSPTNGAQMGVSRCNTWQSLLVPLAVGLGTIFLTSL